MPAVSSGTLWVVATPIGNLDDLSPRALQTLCAADIVLCEDTRVSRRLLNRHNITARLISLHEHNEQCRLAQCVHQLSEGATLALICDAGTPTVSDPGYRLVAAAHAAGVAVISIPGPNAAITALAGSGLPADQFVFVGFLPASHSARRTRLEALKEETRTMVFYEAPHRIENMLEDLAEVFGERRRGCLAKELTKVHEQLLSTSLHALSQWLATDERRCKGEFVVVVEGAAARQDRDQLTLSAAALLEALLAHLPARVAVDVVSQLGGGQRNRLYRAAMKMTGKQHPGKG